MAAGCCDSKAEPLTPLAAEYRYGGKQRGISLGVYSIVFDTAENVR